MLVVAVGKVMLLSFIAKAVFNFNSFFFFFTQLVVVVGRLLIIKFFDYESSFTNKVRNSAYSHS